MNLTRDAMLVSLRITAWSGRLYDREASNHVAAHHDAAASAGRYNKRLLPKAAFAALTATVSACRSTHYEQSLPWDDKGARLLTVANYERYTELMESLRERMVRERARFIEDYDDNVDQARLDLGRLFRIDDYPLEGSAAGQILRPLPHNPGAGRQPLHGEARGPRHRPRQARHREPGRGETARCRGRPLPAPGRGGRARLRAPADGRGRQAPGIPRLDDLEHPRAGGRGSAPQHLRGPPSRAALPGREGPDRERRSRHAAAFGHLQPHMCASR